ncbi:MAG: dihydropteroate synthase [Candidatus Altiarchaeota archaeon]
MRVRFGDKTRLMGVLNVTPDSFSDGGEHYDSAKAFSHARKMIGEGADIIDVGGESTRPGAKSLSLKEELGRVLPAIKEITGEYDIPVSIDSYKPDVVKAALNAGASMVNDVNGLRTPGMAELVAGHGVPVCIMHMQGSPSSMQDNPEYDDVVCEIKAFLGKQAGYAESKGVDAKNILVDPGIGFGKTVEHNLEILRRIDEFKDLGYPLVVGHSRKSFIGKTLDLPVGERVNATVAVTAYLVSHGVELVRVHDVRENREALDLIGRIVMR